MLPNERTPLNSPAVGTKAYLLSGMASAARTNERSTRPTRRSSSCGTVRRRTGAAPCARAAPPPARATQVHAANNAIAGAAEVRLIGVLLVHGFHRLPPA